jgi:hypothetical protein
VSVRFGAMRGKRTASRRGGISERGDDDLALLLHLGDGVMDRVALRSVRDAYVWSGARTSTTPPPPESTRSTTAPMESSSAASFRPLTTEAVPNSPPSPMEPSR